MKDLVLKCHPTATPPVTMEAGEELMLPPTGLAPEPPELAPRPLGSLVTCARFKQWMNLCKQPHLLINAIQRNSLTTVFLLQHCHITNNEDLIFMIRIITSDTM